MEKLSKEFWLAVKKEYSESKGQVFLCHGSKTFEKMWGNKESRLKVKELEKKFMEDNSFNFNYSTLECLLFSRHEGNDYQLKTQFLNWIIKNEHYEM
jgi:hypothetical protein